MDLDEPADVHWTDDLSPGGAGAKKKSCETIAEAVRFVMETLPENQRGAAYIAADRHLHIEDIRAIYASPEYQAFKG